jgi:hypothetical protein
MNDPKEMAQRYFEWLLTEEGQAAQRESRARLAETKRLLDKGREIDWQKLHEPFTI